MLAEFYQNNILKKPNLIPDVKTIALLGPGVTYITK